MTRTESAVRSIALGIPVEGNKRKAQTRLEELKREYSTGSCTPKKSRQESQQGALSINHKVTEGTVDVKQHREWMQKFQTAK